LSEPRRFLEANNIRTVEVSLVDLTGALRGKRLPARAFLADALPGKVAFSSALFAWDYGLEVFSDERYNWATGYPDIFLRPDLSTLRLVGWRPASAFVHSDVTDDQGAELEISPRHILRRAVAACEAAGYRPMVGLESEFYLIDAETRRPVGDRNPVYSLHDGSCLEPVLSEITDALETAGIEVEACGAEYAPGQVEINIKYSTPLQAADDLIFLRYAAKQAAARHGLVATFMAKPFTELSGSGLHVHQSLLDAAGDRNLFYDPGEGGLSELGRHYLCGLLSYAPDTYAVCVPTPNGFRRVRDHSFAPTTLSWGSDNRSVAVRVLRRGAAGTRLESRIAAADANPYLLVAVTLLAGLAGIKDAIAPAPAAVADAYQSGEEALPASLGEAIRLLRASAFAKSVLGERVVELLAAVAGREMALSQEQVSDWERARYLEAV
jgi:glutamine synthetase